MWEKNQWFYVEVTLGIRQHLEGQSSLGVKGAVSTLGWVGARVHLSSPNAENHNTERSRPSMGPSKASVQKQLISSRQSMHERGPALPDSSQPDS